MYHFDAKKANVIHKPAPSNLIRGLTAEEGISLIIFLVVAYVALIVVYLFTKSLITCSVLAIVVFAVFRFFRGLLLYFHRTEKPGFLNSFISYHFFQVKKIYVSQSGSFFRRIHKLR